MAASASRPARSTRCCRTASIAARSCTRAQSILANMLRSSRKLCSMRSSPRLAANRTARVSRHDRDPSPLTGLLFDAAGERLTPSHALKKGVRYRYYVSRHLVAGAKSDRPGLRLPAFGIEALVRSRIGALLADPAELMAILPSPIDQTSTIASALDRSRQMGILPMQRSWARTERLCSPHRGPGRPGRDRDSA